MWKCDHCYVIVLRVLRKLPFSWFKELTSTVDQNTPCQLHIQDLVLTPAKALPLKLLKLMTQYAHT